MDGKIKIIILGFALMIIGGFFYIGSFLGLSDHIQGILTYGLYVGFILVIIGLIIPSNN